jgi:hypothetical protein
MVLWGIFHFGRSCMPVAGMTVRAPVRRWKKTIPATPATCKRSSKSCKRDRISVTWDLEAGLPGLNEMKAQDVAPWTPQTWQARRGKGA